ncbi:MAG: HD domain-containing protein [Mycoplasmatales bacterium]
MKIKDVIHGEINIEEDIIIDLIQTLEFQRLRKIKQLGVTNYTFPGAEHTRYSHSIGVYYIIKLILKKFETSNLYTSEEAIALKVAGLLHDIGHGPLSHAAETFFDYAHEDFTIAIIQKQDGEIHQILKKYDQNNQQNIYQQVIDLIAKEHGNKALNSLISSSIDADRMDYLLRDSYYTGAVYGTIDIQRIISLMKYKENKIVFDSKALYTLEDFILSRYHMFNQVYLNKKSLIYERLLQKILERVFTLYEQSFEFKTDTGIFFDLIEKPILVENYIKINDYNFMAAIDNLYYEEDEQLKCIVGVLKKRVNFYEEFENNIKLQANELILTTDNINKKVYSALEPIFILDETGKVKKIEEVSQIFEFSKTTLTISVKEKKYKVSL